jgi:hypothetical protein
MKKLSDIRVKDIFILYFSTSNFDAMRKCFEDFGFEVTENPNDQLMQMFGNGRAVRVQRGDFDFTLEESTNKNHRAYFNLMLAASGEDVARLKSLGYPCDSQTSPLHGTTHVFQTPDGGKFAVV